MNSIRPTTHPLSEGLVLHHMATERFKSARLSITTVRPADRVLSPTDTLLFGILRRGSARYPTPAAVNRALDELFGTTLSVHNYLAGDHHIITLTAEMPEDDYLPAGHGSVMEGVIRLLAELLLHPRLDGDGLFPAAAVAAEQDILCDAIRAVRHDPRTYASNRLSEIMCEGEPYGLSVGGTVEDVRAITPAALTARYREMRGSLFSTVFYVGRASAGSVTAALRSAFGAWEPRRVGLSPSLPHPRPAAVRRVEEEMPLEQGRLCMGLACGENGITLSDPIRLSALCILNELFGGMPTSRLFRTVRETLGLCYYCESSLDLHKGILTVACGVHPDHRAAAETAILSELSSLQAGALHPQEVEVARLSLFHQCRQMADSRGSLEYAALRSILTGDAPDPLAAIDAVTPAHVADAARMFSLDTVYFLRGPSAGEEEAHA